MDVRAGFLLAVAVAAEVVASREVAARWHEPSALVDFSVGGIAGHAYLAARLVDRRLDEPVPAGPSSPHPLESYGAIRVDDERG